MQEKYNKAIRETFNQLDSASKVDPKEFIEFHMQMAGFKVYVQAYIALHTEWYIYPEADNLPIYIWRRK